MSDLARSRIVAETRSWIGTPYRHQAALRGVGCDCLGLVRGVWRALHGSEPAIAEPYAPDWALGDRRERLRDAARLHLREIAIDEAQPGDVLLFRWRLGLPAAHVAILATSAPSKDAAILATDSTMIHAHDGACVADVTLTRWWRRHLSHAFAFPISNEDC